MSSTKFYIVATTALVLLLFGSLAFQALLPAMRSGSGGDAARAGSPGGGLESGDRSPAAAAELAPDGAAAADAGPGGDGLAAQLAFVRQENDNLRAENRGLQERLLALLNWILANFRGKYPLPESYLARLQVAPVTADFLLHPEAIELLKISPEEEAQINDLFAYARRYLTEIEAALLEVTNPRPDKVVLHIPTFPEEGAALRDDLYAALDVTLGQDRFDRFLTVSEAGLKASFSRFGEASRTMVFELDYTAGDVLPRLKIKDGWVVELGRDVRTLSAMESTVTNLPAEYHAYLAWLPEYVSAFVTR